MRRLVFFISLLVAIGALVAPVQLVSAQGNSEAAHACQEGGYLDYTDADGKAFKNTGQCVRYAAQGGVLMPIRVPDLSISGGQPAAGPGTGTIFGTGFTPNSTIVDLILEGIPFGGPADNEEDASPIDATGAWTTGPRYNFCAFTSTNTAIQITATDAEGVSHTETFQLNCAG